MPKFSHGHANLSLTMYATNLDTSRTWAGQLCLMVKHGNHHFLFENKGSLYHGHGFEMPAALIQHCRPDLVSNAITSLLSIFNDIQGDGESILEYQAQFDGLTIELSPTKLHSPQFYQ